MFLNSMAYLSFPIVMMFSNQNLSEFNWTQVDFRLLWSLRD